MDAYEEAIASLEESIQDGHLDQAMVQKELGLAYRRRGDEKENEAHYEKAIGCLLSIEENSRDAEALAILAGLYRRKQKYKEAFDYYEQARHIDSSSSYILVNLASLYWHQRKMNEARQYFREAEDAARASIARVGFRDDYDRVWAEYDLGLAQLALGKTSEAMVSYNKAIEQTSSKTPLITVLNLLYFLRDTKAACQKIARIEDIVKKLEEKKRHYEHA